MERRLGNMETALQLTRGFAPMSVAGVLQLSGAPSVDTVRRGLEELQRRHPLLRSRIATRRTGRYFEVAGDVPPIPFHVMPRRDDAHWQELAGQVINRNVDVETGPLLACTYLHDAEQSLGDLVFAYDHSAMDAVSAVSLYDQLAKLCAGIAEPYQPMALPPSTDQLLPEHMKGTARLMPLARFARRQAADEIAYRRGIRGRGAPIRAAAHGHILSRTLDAAATDRLVTEARRHRLTMNSVVAAALVAGTYHHLHAGESLPMRALTFAALRPSLVPSPSPDVLGCYISMLRYTMQIGPGDDIWTIGQAFQDQVRDSMDSDEHLLAAGMAKALMRTIIATKRMRMSTTAVSYAGPLAIKEKYGDIEVTGIHGFISNNRLGPVSTAFVKIFRGELTWDFVFLDTDMDNTTAENIADSARDQLVAAGKG